MQEQQSLFGALFIHYSEFQAFAAVIRWKKANNIDQLHSPQECCIKEKLHKKRQKTGQLPLLKVINASDVLLIKFILIDNGHVSFKEWQVCVEGFKAQ